jgi:ABC-type Fe3+/spermidine/putrescine transport system ATPase subunit
VNGQAEGFKLKQLASYVMQEDALHPALTVRSVNCAWSLGFEPHDTQPLSAPPVCSLRLSTARPHPQVHETIMFSARLQLRGASRVEIEDTVEALMQQFGLSHVRNTLVGNSFIAGLSGGQRRRVSIAVEVCNDQHEGWPCA